MIHFLIPTCVFFLSSTLLKTWTDTLIGLGIGTQCQNLVQRALLVNPYALAKLERVHAKLEWTCTTYFLCAHDINPNIWVPTI
jgi:hypothetical protein